MNWMYDSFSRLRVSGFVCFALALFAVWETQPVILLAWYHRDWVFHILCAHITQLLKLKLEHSKCKQSHYKSLCQKTIPRLRLHLTTPWMTVLKTTKALSLSLSLFDHPEWTSDGPTSARDWSLVTVSCTSEFATSPKSKRVTENLINISKPVWASKSKPLPTLPNDVSE